MSNHINNEQMSVKQICEIIDFFFSDAADSNFAFTETFGSALVSARNILANMDQGYRFKIERQEPNNGAKIVIGDLMDVTKGVIAHQVNCMGKIGDGVSGQIIKKFPKVAFEYYKILDQEGANNRFGRFQKVEVNEKLTVLNIFSQYMCGNSLITGVIYTNIDYLVDILEYAVKYYEEPYTVHIPYKIGCGLAGADWNEVYNKIKHLPITIVKLPGEVLQ